MAADHLCRCLGIACAHGKDPFTGIACVGNDGFERRRRAPRLIGKDMAQAARDQHEITGQEVHRSTRREADVQPPLHQQVEPRGLLQIGHLHGPGRRKCGAEIKRALEVERVENIVKYIHGAAL